MITFFRRMFTSKIGGIIALFFLGLIAIAFATGDISNALSGNGGVSGGNVAKVGNRQIGLGELRERIRNAHGRAQQQQPGLSMEAFIASGSADKMLDSLIEGYALEQYALNMGFAVGKKQVDAEIASMPQFKGLTGNFDQGRFEEWMVGTKVTEQELREGISRSLLVEQLVRPIGRVTSVPNSVAIPIIELSLEQRNGLATFLPSSQYVPTSDPADAELAAYFKSNARKYQVPEQRAISYAEFNVKDLAKPEPVTEAEIGDFFKANAAQFAATQKRQFTQVIVADQAAAQKLASAARSGGMATAVSGAGLASSIINATNEADLARSTSLEMAKIGFAAQQGDIIGPMKGALGWIVMKTDSITGSPAKTIDQARDTIRTAVGERKQQEAALDAFNTISDAVNKGATLTEIAKTNGLTVLTSPLLTAGGTSIEQNGFVASVALAKILPSAFQLSGQNLAEIAEIVPNERYAIAEVSKLIAAAPPPLAEVKPRVIADWKQAEGAKKARTIARAIADAAAKSGDLALAARTSGATTAGVQRISGVRKDVAAAGRSGRVPPELSLLFAMDARTTKTYELPGNTGWMVIFLDNIIRGDASKDPKMSSAVMRQMGPVLGNELVGQMLAKAKRDVGAKIDTKALAALKAELSGKAAPAP
jgi:peptidyl-prolyl cis-trans isomerase D